ncbi:DUF6773 family protein [Gorillibacterium timonense]|uniref:DUF6773 family protein n=1 Tax=Gorillibacterium timonense TaxID=1689269 RepID=UPI00071E26EE|nr:DUF6773 family protein [Gorillibacterium timonense]
MKSKNNGLDERQKERRNSIGNQMFMLMFYALFLDSGLYGSGIHWLPYPANSLVIITACMGIYLIRTIAADAYLPPKAHGRKTTVSAILAIVFSVVLAIAAYRLFGRTTPATGTETNDNSALILFLVSAVALLISLIVTIIKKANDKKDSME